jgi:hypothetical protein
MKAKTLSSCILLLALAACQQIASTARAAVTFNVTPSAVSNTYNGTIMLQVSGLTNTETVLVQKFIDLNTNGVVDSGEWLVQQFQLTDGQAGMVIGGIVNSNVPGDTDSTAGQITAQLNFRNGDFIQNIAGQYAFKLSSPGGHFAPITSLFSVTNLPYTQKITGNVVSNGTSTTLPNAVVLLFGPPRSGDKGPKGPPVAGAVADNSGGYTIPAPPGIYAPAAFKAGYVVDFSTLPVITLSSGQTVITNLTGTNATTSIFGTLVDANNPGIALPGVLLPVKSSDGLLAVNFTDANGIFNVPVTAGMWGLKPDDTALIVHGYLGWQNDYITNAGATGVTLTVPKATALFYGNVKDGLGTPLPGIDVYAYDNGSQLYETDAYTDANGKYVAGALGGLGSNDPWSLQISSDTSPTNYIFSQPAFAQNGGTNLSAGATVQVKFTAVLATNHITGSLKDDGGNPIARVGIWAGATINAVDYNLGSVSTDASGNYWLNVANGNWTVGLSTCTDCGDSLPSNYLSPANQSVVIANNNGTVNFTAPLASHHITGHVQQANSNPIGNVGVWASATINSVAYSQYVDADGSGNYSLNVANGSWTVGVECFGGGDSLDNILGSGTYLCPNNQITNIVNNSAVVNFTVQPGGSAPLQITTSDLPGGMVGAYYSGSLGLTGGQPPYTWWLPGGTMSLPPGQSGDMSFSSDGTISGTPGTAGTYTFWVGVYDGASPPNTVTQQVSLTISQSGADVVDYYVVKMQSFVQLDLANTVLNTNTGPFNAYLGLVQSVLGSVPLANVTLPGGSQRALPPGSSGIKLQTQERFADQASIDATYPPGNYTFSLYAVHDGPRNPVLSMPPAAYPNPPHVSNFAAAQSINPIAPFTLQWDLISGATTNDSIWVLVTDASGVVFSTPEPATDHAAALQGTATSVIVPTNTFQPGHAYTGWITYFRTTSLNLSAYPGAAGLTMTAAMTSFPLALNPGAPRLDQAARLSDTQFRFQLSGTAGQTYSVQVLTNLASTNWLTLMTTNLSASPALIQDNQATNKQRFYRVKVGL